MALIMDLPVYGGAAAIPGVYVRIRAISIESVVYVRNQVSKKVVPGHRTMILKLSLYTSADDREKEKQREGGGYLDEQGEPVPLPESELLKIKEFQALRVPYDPASADKDVLRQGYTELKKLAAGDTAADA